MIDAVKAGTMDVGQCGRTSPEGRRLFDVPSPRARPRADGTGRPRPKGRARRVAASAPALEAGLCRVPGRAAEGCRPGMGPRVRTPAGPLSALGGSRSVARSAIRSAARSGAPLRTDIPTRASVQVRCESRAHPRPDLISRCTHFRSMRRPPPSFYRHASRHIPASPHPLY